MNGASALDWLSSRFHTVALQRMGHAVTITVTVLAGCATAPSGPGAGSGEREISTTPANPPSTPPGQLKGPPTIFGHLLARRNGEAQKLGTMTWNLSTFDCVAYLESESDNRGLALEFDKGGWMAWSLDPGDYTFLSLHCNWKETAYTVPIGVRFKAVAGTTAYIGDLGFNYTNNRFEKVAWSSNEADAVAEFARRYPGAAPPVLQTPTRVRDPGQYRSVTSVCAAIWKVACTRKLQGVEPVDPPIERGLGGLSVIGFANVNRLDPTLKWKPIEDPEVTYDVVVREAVAYPRSAIRLTSHDYEFVPGRVVAYAENVAGSEFRIPDPLKPKTRFFWSVRLRKGDQVSSWSVGGHFLFLVVAMSSSSGQWFGFETP
jgi:hypothetical protein